MSQTVPIIALVLTLLLDFAIYLHLKSNYKRARNISVLNVGLVMYGVTSILFLDFSIAAVLFALIGLFRTVNLARVAHARMHAKELRSRFGRSALTLGLSSLLVGYLVIYAPVIDILWVLVSISAVGSVLLFFSALYSILRWRAVKTPEQQQKDLPSVSICIPARNETKDLPGCIESMLASSYPKLEILVLDDCSHDKTPAIIKEYAHQGVRFIKGQEPSSDWLAKNYAMNRLFDESKGQIVVFAGVDVRLQTDSIYNIVQQLESGLDMISVLPKRSDTSELSVFIQPLRYWWELAVPKLLNHRPAALSTLWAIRRSRLEDIGEFESVKRTVQTEKHFAKRMADKYRFIISGSRLGVVSAKAPREQFDTALRTRYPQAKRRPESVLAILLVELLIFVSPVVGFVYGLANSQPAMVLMAGLSIALLVLVNVLISMLTVRKTWFAGFVSLPFLLAEEWYVLLRSMLAYEFGVVRWKERNICLPMLKVEESLPNIDK